MTRGHFARANELKKEWQGKEWMSEDFLFASLFERELAERGELPPPEAAKPLSLAEFTRKFWHVLEPDTALKWGWALDAMCLHLEAAARRRIRKLIINVPPGTMKPVYNESMILEQKRGRIAIKDVRLGDMVLTHRGRFRRVLAIHDQGDLNTLTISTHSGRELRLAPDHPVLTARGWIEAGSLTDRDVLARVNPQEAHGGGDLARSEARLMGYLAGDGHLGKAQISFTNQVPEVVSDFIACAEAQGFTTRNTPRPPSYGKLTGSQTFIVSITATKTGEKDWRSAVPAWRRLRGMYGNSATKRVPAAVLEAPANVIADYLAAYWACDGMIQDRRDVPRADRGGGQVHNSVRIDCTTISEGLGRDLQHLLSRLGLAFNLRRKVRKMSAAMTTNPERVGTDYASWNLSAQDQDTCARFMEMIGTRIPGEKGQRAAGLTRRDFDRVLTPDPVRSIEAAAAAPCMCLTVEEDASFTVSDIAVHNSSLCNVFFPAWVWAEMRASERFLCVSFNEDLSTRDSVAMRRLVESVEYQARYGERVRLMRDQNSKKQYDTTARGRRAVKSIMTATGSRAGILIVDDPNNATDIDSPAHRRAVNNAYDSSLRMRGADQSTFVQIVIMQRLHEDDLTGHLEKKASGWEILRLPERYEPESPTVTSLWTDPRTERGELLFPDYRSEVDVSSMEVDLGSFGAASQLQQRPVPIGGGIVKSWWWRFHAPAELLSSLPPIMHKVFQEDGSVITVPAVVIPTPAAYDWTLSSWDMTFKDTKGSDWVAGQAWGGVGANAFLLDQTRGKFSFTRTLTEMGAFLARWPDIHEHLIEDKANGTAILDTLRDHVPGLIPVNPTASKVSRLTAQAPTIQAGNVYLPHPSLSAWVLSEYLREFSAFPNGATDDQVDATSQALQRLKSHLKTQKDTEGHATKQPVRLAGLALAGGNNQSKWRGK